MIRRGLQIRELTPAIENNDFDTVERILREGRVRPTEEEVYLAYEKLSESINTQSRPHIRNMYRLLRDSFISNHPQYNPEQAKEYLDKFLNDRTQETARLREERRRQTYTRVANSDVDVENPPNFDEPGVTRDRPTASQIEAIHEPLRRQVEENLNKKGYDLSKNLKPVFDEEDYSKIPKSMRANQMRGGKKSKKHRKNKRRKSTKKRNSKRRYK